MRHELTLLREQQVETPELVSVSPHFVILAELEAGPRTVYELTLATGDTLLTTTRAVALLERQGRVSRETASDGRRIIRRRAA